MKSYLYSLHKILYTTNFSRVDEYIFFIFIGDSSLVANDNDMLRPVENDKEIRWASLLRSGNNSARTARPNLFYPLYFNKISGDFVGVRGSLKLNEDENSILIPDDCFIVLPKKINGSDATWTLQQKTFLDKLKKGFIKFGPWKKGSNFRSIGYLAEGTQKAVENGEIEIIGKDKNGTVILGKSFKRVSPLTVWNQSLHSAGDYGSSYLLNLFGDKRFAFPKSLYAVHLLEPV